MTTFAKIGTEILVNTNIANAQSEPTVAALDNGYFVVIWRTTDVTADGSGNAVKGQIIKADGTKVGTEFLVNTIATGDQRDPEVTALAGGKFVVSYTTAVSGASTIAGGTDDLSEATAARIFTVDNAGVATAGTEFQVNTTKTDYQAYSSITALSTGGFVVVFEDYSTGNGDVRFQRYDAAGNKVGLETLAHAPSIQNQYDPQVTALADGGFAIVWEDADPVTDSDAEFRRFDKDGNALGVQTVANTATTGDQDEVDIAGWSDGSFVVVWREAWR
jgi:hypothetical protein